MTEFYQRMMGAIPPPQPQPQPPLVPQKSHLEKLRRHGTVYFFGKKEREFVRLSQYGKEIVSTEVKRCRRFEEGLNDNIKVMITALEITDFAKLVNATSKVERVRINEQTRRERQHKRSLGQSSSFSAPSKKNKGPPAQSSGQPQGQG